jgi:hypothetical protein
MILEIGRPAISGCKLLIGCVLRSLDVLRGRGELRFFNPIFMDLAECASIESSVRQFVLLPVTVQTGILRPIFQIA